VSELFFFTTFLMQFFVGLFIVISGRPGWDFENLGGDGRAQEASERG
jgi:hypothetical protein